MNDATISQLQSDTKRMKDKMANLELKVENLTHSNKKLQELVSELTVRLESFADTLEEKDKEISKAKNNALFESMMSYDQGYNDNY